MQAVIATGGKQYRVSEGDTLDVEHVAADEDGVVRLRPVMVSGDDGVVATPDALAGYEVRGSVLEHGRGDKIVVFRYKPKKGYRKRGGHRQGYTRLRIDTIAAPAEASEASTATT